MRELSFEGEMVALYCYERAESAEGAITAVVRGIAGELEGGRLSGLGERLKSVEAYKRKAAEWLAGLDDGPDGMAEIQEIIQEVPDLIRYTFELRADNFAVNCRTVVARLEEHGYRCAESAERHTVWRMPDGQRFEVQFHTPDSLAARELLYPVVQRLRDPRTTEREAMELKAFVREVSERADRNAHR